MVSSFFFVIFFLSQFINRVHFTIALSNIYNLMKYECFYLQLCSQQQQQKKKRQKKKNCERSPRVFVCLSSRGFAFNKIIIIIMREREKKKSLDDDDDLLKCVAEM